MRHASFRIAWMACALVTLPATIESEAFLFSSSTTHVDTTQTAKRMADCVQFKLKEVHSVHGSPERTYWFIGKCRIWVDRFVGGKKQGASDDTWLWAEAKATWNAQSNRLTELVKLTDPGDKYSGTVRSEFKCMQDPILQKASCVRLEFANLTDWTGFSVPADKDRSMLEAQTTPVEVAGLTKTSAPQQPVATKSGSTPAVGSTPALASDPVRALPPFPARPMGGTAPSVGLKSDATQVAAGRDAAGGSGASVARDLAAASCTPGADGLRFSCATRAGFDRCETFRAQRKVAQCVLNERR